jgi:DNA-binding transcriptional regulator YdaS (Cro superfamily)
MTSSQYKSIVESIGSITAVAALLGVARETVSRRCSGAQDVTAEAALAIQALNAQQEHGDNAGRR